MSDRVSTGVLGLDNVLCGGLLPGRAYLLSGGPGHGKTTLGAHFLEAGRVAGERGLFISLSERPQQVLEDVGARGIDLSGVEVLDLRPSGDELARFPGHFSVFEPGVIEGPSITARIIETVERCRPDRVLIDSLTHIRFLSSDVLSYRRQVGALLAFLHERGCTVMGTAESGPSADDIDLRFLCDGVICLEREPDRAVEVVKFQGSDYIDGAHSLRLNDQGMVVYPRLVPIDHRQDFDDRVLSSGIASFDAMLHGGLEAGTITILTGPSGVGKTTLGFQFMAAAAARGERSSAFIFEENLGILRRRCEAVGIPITAMEKAGNLSIQVVEPLSHSPDHFVADLRREVEKNGSTLVMIDSVSGYRLSIREGRHDLVATLHALTKYLQNMGVTVLLVNEVETLTGDFKATEAGISYLSDAVIFLRYLEYRGELTKAVGILKKRLSGFERSMRSFEISREGLTVGAPLSGLRGILSGIPEWVLDE